MKRYSLNPDPDDYQGMIPDDEGPYVLYSELATLRARLAAAEGLAEALRASAAVLSGTEMNKNALIDALEKSRAALAAWDAK